MKKLTAKLFFLVLFIVIILNFSISPNIISPIYTVSGIMFSIGFALIITFNMSGVKNADHIRYIRKELLSIRTNFLVHFFISTMAFMASQNMKKFDYMINYKGYFYFTYHIDTLFCVLILSSVFYFIVTFLRVHKLSNDIFDRILKEEKDI